MAQAMIRWAQHTTGVSVLILESTSSLPRLEGIRLSQLQDSMHRINAQINHTKPWTNPTFRVHDKHIMDIFMANDLKSMAMRKLNYCQLYLQVTHFSDITTLERKRLHLNILREDATRLNNPRQTLQWPLQAKLNKATWQLWIEMLKLHG
eukprot:621668-Ditylum_brightwellii.AAC.1